MNRNLLKAYNKVRNDYDVTFSEQDATVWKLFLPASKFEDKEEYCFLNDCGTWSPLSREWQSRISELGKNDFALLELGGQEYYVSMDDHNTIHQQNMETQKRREIKKVASGLGSDLVAYSKKTGTQPGVEYEIRFKEDFPRSPPFVRVIRPRFQFHTGHVTVGGSICVESLTNQAWARDPLTMDGVFTLLQHLLVEGGGRVDLACKHPYTLEEARLAFGRVSEDHGWK